MKKYLLTSLVMLTIMITACTSTPTGQVTQEETLKIRVIGALSGFGSYYGQQELRGVKLAVNQINDQGGIDGKIIEIVVEDSKTEAKSAVSAAQKLINVDKVDFIIGDTWAATTEAIIPITNDAEIILISPVAVLDTMSQDDYFFRTIPSIKSMTDPLAEYAYEKWGAKKTSLLLAESSFGFEHGNDFSQRLEELGGEVVGRHTFTIDTVDMRTILTKVKNENPDVILNIHASGPKLGMVMEQAKELGIEAHWVASFAAENADLIKDYRDEAAGLTYPYYYDPESSEKSVQQFIANYKATYGEIPDGTAANSYDALMIIAHAIEAVGEETYSVREYLLTVEDYHGGSGVISFDENGDVEKEIFIKQVTPNGFVRLT